MAKRQLKYVGHSVPRVDGVDKVTGKAKFVGDITVPGMLYGKILRSPYPHARIRAIDATEAEALSGVVAVLTATIPGKASASVASIARIRACGYGLRRILP